MEGGHERREGCREGRRDKGRKRGKEGGSTAMAGEDAMGGRKAASSFIRLQAYFGKILHSEFEERDEPKTLKPKI